MVTLSDSDANSDKGQDKEEKPQPVTPPAVPAQTQQPPAPKTPPPPTTTKINRDPDKRNFFKMIVGLSAAFTLIPLIPGGIFLTAQVGGGVAPVRQRLANASDLKPNSSMNFIYPKTGNPDKDNDPFRQFILVRLPEDIAREEGTEFKAYSQVCVHLWCLWRFVPAKKETPTEEETPALLACPCHGSMYDPVTGIAVCGPAALQAPPSDTLPELDLEVNNETGEIFGVKLVGDLGLGRTTDRKAAKPAVDINCLG